DAVDDWQRNGRIQSDRAEQRWIGVFAVLLEVGGELGDRATGAEEDFSNDESARDGVAAPAGTGELQSVEGGERGSPRRLVIRPRDEGLSLRNGEVEVPPEAESGVTDAAVHAVDAAADGEGVAAGIRIGVGVRLPLPDPVACLALEGERPRTRGRRL